MLFDHILYTSHKYTMFILKAFNFTFFWVPFLGGNNFRFSLLRAGSTLLNQFDASDKIFGVEDQNLTTRKLIIFKLGVYHAHFR